MKIFYAVQATGNGHISRARQLLPYLQEYGDVDIFLSGNNASLNPGIHVKYKSQGLSLYYRACGGLHYTRMFLKNNLLRARREARHLPIEKYDLVINDFEYITALACRKKGVSSIQFGHQASFMSPNTPRPAKRSLPGEFILKKYATADRYIGLHFQPYDRFIFPPVIKKEILEAEPKNKGHITVYLPSYKLHCLQSIFEALEHLEFHWFLKEVKNPYKKGNIRYYPISDHLFTQSMIECDSVITGGGFETPAEVLYLGKKLMSIPMRDHYEQKCNAAALKQLGVTVLEDIDVNTFGKTINEWISSPPLAYIQPPNDIRTTLDYVVDKSSIMVA